MRDLLAGIVGGQVEIVGDIEIAFEDAFASGPGVMLIAGTGSIAFGRNKMAKPHVLPGGDIQSRTKVRANGLGRGGTWGAARARSRPVV